MTCLRTLLSRRRSEAGESLVEIVIGVVLIGLVMSALSAGFATASKASKTHRDATTADTVMRAYAEAIKLAVRTNCVGGIGTPTVSYTPPAGYTVAPPVTTCPPTQIASGSLAATTLTVTWNGGSTVRTMQIGLRSA